MLTTARVLSTRLLQVIIVALVVMIGTSLLVRLVPGDAARTILGDKASPGALDALRQTLGLDRPIAEQIFISIGRLVQGDLGTSFNFRGQTVTSLIVPALLVTACLAALAILLSLLVGIPLGLGLALVRSSGADLLGRLSLTVLVALPSFMAGLILLYLVSIRLRIAPAGGWAGSWPSNFGYIWLPAVALSLYLGPLIARTVRQAALETIQQPFVEAARARGVSRHRVIICHVLPNAALPVIPLVGFNAGVMVSGAVTVEAIFALPGLGAQLVQAMGTRDFPIVQGIALLTAVSVVVFNLLADLLNLSVDPRLRSR